MIYQRDQGSRLYRSRLQQIQRTDPEVDLDFTIEHGMFEELQVIRIAE
jgi:hypothetical protein